MKTVQNIRITETEKEKEGNVSEKSQSEVTVL